MKILLIDSNLPINNRNLKLIESLSNYSDVEVVVVTWCRNDNVSAINYIADKQYVYKKESKLGNKFKKVINIFGYYTFIKRINKEERPDIIIASHWDMLLLSSFLKRKTQFLIYENLDIPTHNKKFVLAFLKVIERFALKKTDYIIHASRFYKKLYSFFNKEQQVLENLPKLENYTTFIETTKSKKIVISFIGGIRYTEVLFKLIAEASKFSNIEIHLHGEGHESEKLNEFVNSNNFGEYVLISGRYDYKDISKFYLQSHFIWAVYPSNNYNVKYAISNKFHESIHFNVPGIYAKDTELGNFVEVNNIGVIVGITSIEIFNLLNSIVKEEIDVNELKENLQKFKQIENHSWEAGVEYFYKKLKMLE